MKTEFHTLLVQLPGSIHRIDMLVRCADNHVELAGLCTHQRHTNATPADAIRLARMLPKQRHRTVWLLTAEAWSGTIELEQDIVTQLDAKLLPPALALEAEYDSGFVGSDCQLAAEIAGSTGCIWLATQVPNQTVAKIQEEASAVGCHVSYITALPSELSAAENMDETAVEAAALEFVRQQIGQSPCCPPVVLEDTLRNRRIVNVAYATTAAILLIVCIGLYQRVARKTADSASQLAELQTQVKRFDAMQSQLTQELDKREKNRSDAASENSRRQQLVANRRIKIAQLQDRGDAVSQLLDALQIASDDNVWVASLKYTCTVDSTKAEIAGLATTALQVTRFAASLNDALVRKNSQWEASVDSIAAENVVTSFKLSVVKRVVSNASLAPTDAASSSVHQARIDRWFNLGGPVG